MIVKQLFVVVIVFGFMLILNTFLFYFLIKMNFIETQQNHYRPSLCLLEAGGNTITYVLYDKLIQPFKKKIEETNPQLFLLAMGILINQ